MGLPTDFSGQLLAILSGLPLTLTLTLLALGVGMVGAIVIALMRMSGVFLLSTIAYLYVFVFRGTPLLVQLYLIFYGLPQTDFVRESPILWPIFRDPFFCAVLALAMNTAAYTSEIIRGGIAAVPKGEVEAARAVGMSRLMILRRIVAPITIRQALPAYGNEIVLMVKASALAATVTMMEMTGIARRLMAQTYVIFEVFIIAGAIYLFINFVLTELVRFIEYRMTAYLRSRSDDGSTAPMIERYIARPLGFGLKLAQ
jgi:octopine/nopaline transport system permease protein